MWITRLDNNFTGIFRVEHATGNLISGLVSNDFVCQIVNPQNTANLNIDVNESIIAGLYRFIVPSSFLQLHGIGEYGILVSVLNVPLELEAHFNRILKVYNSDIDLIDSKVEDAQALIIAT